MATARKSMRGRNARRIDTGDPGGFTIIEVVLVLAIAGLIFLMVFIALPALQRAQRDSQRREDLVRVATAVTQYQTNNNGKLPGGSEKDEVDPAEEGEDTIFEACTTGTTASNQNNNPAACFIRNYMNSVNAQENEFVDPDGWQYGLYIDTLENGAENIGPRPSADGEPFSHIITFYKHAACNGETAVYSRNSRDYAILYKLEGSGTYCSDNGGSGAKGSTTE